jgi:SpoVK/Ycf46/Vps4 family AAA+-type ATPase
MTRICKLPVNEIDEHPLNDVACLWALRILVNLNGVNGLFSSFGGVDSEVLRTIGSDELSGADSDKKDLIKKMKKMQERYEANPPGIKGVLQKNIIQFGKLLGLSSHELKIFGFAVAIHSHRGLENAADTLGTMSGLDVSHYLSGILQIPLKDIQDAMASHSQLSNSGILRLSKIGPAFLLGKLDLMNGLNEVLQEPQSDLFGMLHNYFQLAKESTLCSSDFEYISKDFSLINSYLRKATEKKMPGVNILIHGRPGTGKSELVKTIANELGFNLYEISVVSRDGDALTGTRRFSAYQLCQKILSRQDKTLILFDEVEDVFPGDSLMSNSFKTNEDRRKAWINRLLETNPVPAVWVSNNIEQIDHAFIRRFDFVFKLDTPPKKIRAKILNKHFSELAVSNQWIDNMAENSNIAPALVSRAARVVSLLNQDSCSGGETEGNLEHIIGNTLVAMGYSDKVCKDQNNAFSYRLDALNPDVDIHQLVEGLKNRSEGRLCLYGPPGTGKTEFGRYVAKVLEKPLIVKRASDLLGPYVGMTEKHIANMFQQAQQEEAVLLLDEADSFLRDRKGAQHSWEVTQVNEMLTQMEQYEGIFICSTNLVDNLDAASLRRFDLKINFGYLKPDQSWILFQQILKDHGNAVSARSSWKSKLLRYNNLTPGDFATVVRQNRLCKAPMDAGILLSGLNRESEFKQTNKSAGIGFMASI